jgi:hypothetical protein
LNEKRKEIIVLVCIIVVIPAVIYFTSPINKIVCAHTFSNDNAASSLGIMEEYKGELNLIRNNLDSNFTLSHLHANNVIDQGYISRIANQIYSTESHKGGELTNSFNNLEGEISTMYTHNNSLTINAIRTQTGAINSMLDNCKKLFVDSHVNDNSTINALTINNLLDSSLRYYDSGTSRDSNGNVISIKNPVYYQNAVGFANRSIQLLNQIDTSQFQQNAAAAKVSLFKNLQNNFVIFKNYIDHTENYNKIMVLLHIQIKANLQKLFNLK